ncbi:MAG: hypothetical protein GC158_12415 [Cyanobacteria bacterium RI_101]|nr:hypothetical protein [Cyanobacteria bacterium RI_101]
MGALFILGLGLSLALSLPVGAQERLKPEDLTARTQSQMTPPAQARHRQKQLNFIQPQRFDLKTYPVSAATESHWRQTLWATALLEPNLPETRTALTGLLQLGTQGNLTAPETRIVEQTLQVATQLYLANPERENQLEQALTQLTETSPSPQWAGMALSALTQGGLDPVEVNRYRQSLEARFPGAEEFLTVALRDLDEQIQPSPLPPLADLVNWRIAPDQSQLYVFCRPQRGTLCRAFLKDKTGAWVRATPQPGAPLWSMPLSGRSLHGLRWNFIRGAAPQGLYRIDGVMPRSEAPYFPAYGQFPLLKVFLPQEDARFAPSLAQYQTLLPPRWREYFPLQQSYWAGRLGRSLIRIHGSGEFPDFFANNRRFPQSWGWNPAIGCLSALERYDDRGELLKGDMPDLLQRLSQAQGGNLEGYLLVVDVPGDETAPVTPKEIEGLINQES